MERKPEIRTGKFCKNKMHLWIFILFRGGDETLPPLNLLHFFLAGRPEPVLQVFDRFSELKEAE